MDLGSIRRSECFAGEHTGWVLKPDDNPDSVIELDLA